MSLLPVLLVALGGGLWLVLLARGFDARPATTTCPQCQGKGTVPA